MNTRNLFLMFVVLAMIVPVSGCKFIQIKAPGETVCDSIPDGSYSIICQIAEKMNTTPETAASLLKVSNVAAIAGNVYTAQQADAFIDDIISYVEVAKEKGLATAVIYGAARTKFSSLPPEIQAAFTVCDDILVVDDDLLLSISPSEYDWAMILKHLADQKKIVAPFLLAVG